MVKKAAYTVSILHRLTLLLLIVGIIALLALSISARIANDTKGSAYMINQLGLLRMKNYQLLTMIPLKPQDNHYLKLFANLQIDNKTQTILKRYHLLEQFKQLQNQWNNSLVQKIRVAKSMTQVHDDVAQYVVQIDQLVHAIDQRTEQQIATISRIQISFIILIVCMLALQFYYLRRYLLRPWRQLIAMAESITQHQFTQRFYSKNRRQTELDLLGAALNRMSEQIENQYQQLESSVTEKTNQLLHKNEVLLFLYQAIEQLHTNKPVCEKFLSILKNLEHLTPLSHFQVRVYEMSNPEQYVVLGYTQQRPQNCQNANCSACLIPTLNQPMPTFERRWYLQDKEQKYGMLLAQQPHNQTLNSEQEELIAAVVEQMSMTLMLEQQAEYQTQLLLMQERSAMARELHDSIAQSLSCIKIHLSCLQMQNNLSQEESVRLLQTMRKDVNVAYSQLRELITTFRLQVNRTGFLPSLQDMIQEFNQKLGFNITLDYQLPAQAINSHHAIHLLQIIREALNNIYKHAKASQVTVSLQSQPQDIIALSIVDNGIGLQSNWKKSGHYGLMIMRDRVDLLQGYFQIESRPNQGTTINITFKHQLKAVSVMPH